MSEKPAGKAQATKHISFAPEVPDFQGKHIPAVYGGPQASRRPPPPHVMDYTVKAGVRPMVSRYPGFMTEKLLSRVLSRQARAELSGSWTMRPDGAQMHCMSAVLGSRLHGCCESDRSRLRSPTQICKTWYHSDRERTVSEPRTTGYAGGVRAGGSTQRRPLQHGPCRRVPS